MPIDEASSNYQRREKVRRQYKLKNLPYHLDSSVIDEELTQAEQQKGVGRALKRIQEAVQGNFDHMSAEMTRFAKLYNEGEADSAYMRDLLDPHEHESGLAKGAMRGADDTVRGKNYIHSYNSGTEDETVYVVEDAIGLTPFWVGENVYVDRFTARVDDIDTAVNRTLVTGVYIGDGPGGLPYTLIQTPTPVAYSASGDVAVTLDLNLKKNTWYWVATTSNAAGTDNAFWKVHSLGSEGSGRSHWWPFPHFDDWATSGTSMNSYVWQDLTTPWTSASALPANLTINYDTINGSPDGLVCSLRVP